MKRYGEATLAGGERGRLRSLPAIDRRASLRLIGGPAGKLAPAAYYDKVSYHDTALQPPGNGQEKQGSSLSGLFGQLRPSVGRLYQQFGRA